MTFYLFINVFYKFSKQKWEFRAQLDSYMTLTFTWQVDLDVTAQANDLDLILACITLRHFCLIWGQFFFLWPRMKELCLPINYQRHFIIFLFWNQLIWKTMSKCLNFLTISSKHYLQTASIIRKKTRLAATITSDSCKLL